MKTISLKKIAIVAVSALGISLVGTSASNAANEVTYDKVTAINLTKVTASPTVGSAVFVNVGMTTGAIAGASASLTLVGKVTAPAGGYVQVNALGTISGGSTEGTFSAHFAGGSAGVATGASVLIPGGANTSALLAGSTASSATAGVASMTFTPTVAGTYTLTVWHNTTAGATGDVDFNETRQTIDIVVAAAKGYSAPLSTMYLGTGTTQATSTTDLLPVSASKTAGTVAANIRVAIKDSAGTAYVGQTVTASVSGPGLISGASDAAANTANTAVGTARVSAVVATAGFASFTLASDGTSGTSTVTISVTDKISGATTTLGTKSVTFYGSVTALTSTANYTILKAGGGVTGGTTGSSTTVYENLANRINATDIPAVVVKAVDSSGNPAGGLLIKIRSGDVTKGNSTTVTGADDTNGCIEDVRSAANVYSSGGTGFYNCALSTPSSAKSGDATTMTFYVLDPADVLGVAELTTVVNVTVGGTTPGTETITFDKTSYAPGEAMNVTRTCKDTSGNPCADGVAAPAITFSKAVGGTAPGASTYTAGKKSSTSSTGVASVFAPVIGGAFSANATSGNAAGSAVTASSTVTDANAGLLTQIDALNAKIVALNALIAKIMKKLGVK